MPCEISYIRRLPHSGPPSGRRTTIDEQRFCVYNTPSIIQDVDEEDACRLYPPRRRGTGGYRESYPDWRTSPKNYCCFSSRKESSTRTHHLPDGVRLRQRTPGR